MTQVVPEDRNGAADAETAEDSELRVVPVSQMRDSATPLRDRSVLLVGDASDETIRAVSDAGATRVAVVDLESRASRAFAATGEPPNPVEVVDELDLSRERFDVVVISPTEDELAVSLSHPADIVVEPDTRLAAFADNVSQLLLERELLRARLAKLGEALRDHEIVVAELAEASAAYEAAVLQLAAAEQLAERRHQELSRARADLSTLTSSSSWRLTRPLRWGRQRMRRA